VDSLVVQSPSAFSSCHFAANLITDFYVVQGNEFLCEVSEDFIRDEFNLYGLSLQVPFYARAISIIMGEEIESAAPAPAAAASNDQDDAAESSAEILYGLIHARFIMTVSGLSKMADKYRQLEFGRCARVLCQGQPLIPAGESDMPQKNAVKVFCCRCKELYRPDSSKVSALDGAYFGRSFAHMFFMQVMSTVAWLSTNIFFMVCRSIPSCNMQRVLTSTCRGCMGSE
jgi:casein kinase II subunit beta